MVLNSHSAPLLLKLPSETKTPVSRLALGNKTLLGTWALSNVSNMQKNFHQQTEQNFVATTSALNIYKMYILKDPTPNCLCSVVFV